jgi:hypothetical protein
MAPDDVVVLPPKEPAHRRFPGRIRGSHLASRKSGGTTRASPAARSPRTPDPLLQLSRTIARRTPRSISGVKRRRSFVPDVTCAAVNVRRHDRLIHAVRLLGKEFLTCEPWPLK